MKKLLTLLTLLLCVVVGAKAEEMTLFSADAIATSDQSFSSGLTTEVTSAQATIKGGKMYVINGQDVDKNLITSEGFVMTNNNTYFKIVLESALAVGDKITATSYGGDKNGTAKGIWVTVSESRPGSAPACSAAATTPTTMTPNFLNYTVTEGSEYIGATELYVHRAAGATQHFDEFVVTRTIEDRTAVSLSFTSATANANLGESFTAPNLTVAPVAASSEVTYTSSNTAVAAVAADGTVTINAAGTTTITAAISGSATYKDASASYTLTVVDPNATGYTDAAASVTWSMATGASSKGIASPEDAILSTTWTVGTGLQINSKATETNGEVTYTRFNPISNHTDIERDNGYNIDWTFTPAKGISFKPTKVSFNVVKRGTGDPTIDVDLLDGNTQTKLGTQVAINRDFATGNPTPQISYNLTNAATTNAITLRIYIRKCNSGKQVAIGNVVIEGTVNGTVEAVNTYTITAAPNIDVAGVVSGSTEYAEGSTATLLATANTGYAFLNWTKASDGSWSSTSNPLTVSDIQADDTYTANFKDLYDITYDFSAEGIEKGTVSNILQKEYASVSDKFTAPQNVYLTKNGYTFVKWTDGTNDYTPGTEYTLTDDITLQPIFTENTQSLAMTTASTVVTWSFTASVATFNMEGKTGYYVKQAQVNGDNLDVVMVIDATDGKLNNVNRPDEWAQANGGTKLTIPAVAGMTVVATGFKQFTNTTIAGSTDYEATTKSPWKASYNYSGTDATIDIVIGSDISYLSSVAVTYPKTHTYVDVKAAGYRTFASSSALDFSETIEGLTAYKATVSGDAVSFSAIDCAVPAGEGMLIKAAEGRYYIPLATGTPAAIDNAFVGVTAAEEVPAGIFVLMNGDQGVGFYKTKNAFTVGANTAYLPASAAPARSFIGFSDDETTGINALMGNEKMNGEVYNLNGQRVAAPQKGLYIVNGKKVVMK